MGVGKSALKPLDISKVEPPTGDAAGGTTTKISGRGLKATGAVAVEFGGRPATDISAAGGLISCKTPPHPPGKVAVTVAIGENETTKENAYTYV